MTPTIGRVVHVLGGVAVSNGANVAPAIITRVWEQANGTYLINCTVFPDASPPRAATSVKLVKNHTEAKEHGHAAFWPPR